MASKPSVSGAQIRKNAVKKHPAVTGPGRRDRADFGGIGGFRAGTPAQGRACRRVARPVTRLVRVDRLTGRVGACAQTLPRASGELDAGLGRELVDPRQGPHHPREPVGGGVAPVPFPFALPLPCPFPVSHTVILSILRFWIALTCCSTILGSCSIRSSVGPTEPSVPQASISLPVALGLGLHHQLHALGLGLVLQQDRVGLALGLAPVFLGLGLGGDLDPLLLDLLRSQVLLAEAGHFLLALGEGDRLGRLGVGDLRPLAGPGLDFRELRVALGHGARLVFSPMVAVDSAAATFMRCSCSAAFLLATISASALGDRDLAVTFALHLALDRLGLHRRHRDALLLLGQLLALDALRQLGRHLHRASRTAIASPTEPVCSCCATSTLARFTASAAARLPIASM